jgi:hypothetical protein
MAEDTQRRDPPTEHVTVVREGGSFGGIILGIIALAIIAGLVIWLATSRNDNGGANSSITTAAQKVGNAADKVGDAAGRSGNAPAQ